jgi:hypothetical protein
MTYSKQRGGLQLASLKFAVFTLTAVGTLFFAAISASATGTLDQSQTNADAGVEGIPSVSGGRLAQTFTAGITGSLDQVDLLLARNGSPGDLTVQILSVSGGVPSSTVLAAATVLESSVTPEGVPVWVSVPFAIPAASSAGTQYAIVISASSICGSDCYQWGTALSDPYAGGEALDSADSGSTWFSPGAGLDRAFKTYVTSPPSPTSIAQCKEGGWSSFPQFKNQGDCVSFVATGGKAPPG